MTIPTVKIPDYASIPDSDDPFAVIYVVNDSRDDAGSIAAERDILQASTDALVKLLTSEDEVIVARVREWTDGRIRKIVKRGRASAWNKADALEAEHFIAAHNGVEVMVFAPMRLSEQPKDLKRLQVTGLNSDDYTPVEHGNDAHLLVKVNDSLGMSTGKVVAQVGHAVQLFLMLGDIEQIMNWKDNESKLRVVRAENLDETATTGIVVHDAGFTEVPSGSLTATAEYIFTTEGK